jgi:ketosteroid isomerase-like protein
MSKANVELVKSWFARWNRGEREFGSEEVDPEVEISSQLQGEPFRGHEGLRVWMQEIDDQFDEWSLIADEWHDREEFVVAMGRVALRGRGSGVTFEQPAGWLVEVRDSRIYRMRTFLDPADARRAAGIEEAG